MSLEPKIDQEISRLIANSEEIATDLVRVLELLRGSLPMRDYMGLRMRSAELHTGATKLLHLAAQVEALRSTEYLTLKEPAATPSECPQCSHPMTKHHEVEGVGYKCWHGDVAERCRCKYRQPSG